jgi:hydrogenase maturation protein HypF
MLDKNINCPMTSSMGRLFDAVAALLGIRDSASYEGQAAVELEWLADRPAEDGAYPYDIDGQRPSIIDTRPLIQAIAKDVETGTDPARIARRFHSTVVAFSAEMCDRIREDVGLNAVTLSGGVFMNSILTRELTARLTQHGFRAYLHREVPPNDGSLSLGQVAVAAARLSQSGDSQNTFATALESERNMVASIAYSGT